MKNHLRIKVNVFKITTIVLMLSGSFSCEDSIEYLYRLPSSEKREIIKIFKDEPGFVLSKTDDVADRIWYYFFVPETPDDTFSEQLYFWTKTGSPEDDLYKYISPYKEIKVKISGNVTNSISLHKERGQDGVVTNEYNILEVLSIKE